MYGRESMRRMASSKILVSGMKGLGAEVAKNVILAGVRACTIHDDEAAELKVRAEGRRGGGARAPRERPGLSPR